MPNEIKRVINTFLLSLLFVLPMNAQEQAIMIGMGRSSQLDISLSRTIHRHRNAYHTQ